MNNALHTSCQRGDISSLQEDSLSNAGLLYNKFLLKLNLDQKGGEEGQKKQQALCKVIKSLTNRNTVELYQKIFDRMVKRSKAQVKRMVQFDGSLTLGLGIASVQEIGFSFHPLYGVPYIAGSSLKGLASHYAHQVWGEAYQDDRYRRGGEIHALMFGESVEKMPGGEDNLPLSTEEGVLAQQGLLFFHDAWLYPQDLDKLRIEVMTPHHIKYYEGDGDPDEMEDPVPVLFFSLRNARFFVQVESTPGPNEQKWAETAAQILEEALQNWGIGSKTSSGHGRIRNSTTTDNGTDCIVTPSDDVNQKPVGSSVRPAYKPGDRLMARRIEDPKGKNRLWFCAEMDESLEGNLLGGLPQDQWPEIGQTMELELANLAKPYVNWRLPNTKTEKPSPKVSGNAQRRQRHR